MPLVLKRPLFRVLRAKRFFRTYEDVMNKKISGNDSKIKQQDSKKPAATKLQDDDLQQVAGGLAASHAALATDPVCISKL